MELSDPIKVNLHKVNIETLKNGREEPSRILGTEMDLHALGLYMNYLYQLPVQSVE